MPKYLIETHGLTRRFGKQLAVDDVSLVVPEAGVYGFLGPNGAGKTTAIRMLLGLCRPNAGEVHLFGLPLAANRLSLLRRVGALVESPSLYPHLTGRENLEVTRRVLGAQRELIDTALRSTKLTQDANRRVREYSLGMRQRLGLALALLTKPELLILDEPTNGLDPAGIHEMRDMIRRLPAEFGVTVFLSSHLLSEVEQIASHIGIIHEGRLLFQGTLSELQADQQVQLTLGVNEADQAMDTLTAAGWSVQRRADGLLSVSAKTSDEAVRINKLLVEQGIEVFHLSLVRASLEDIFLTLTGERRAA
ncbi:MAG TPA: ATP-binding cassette domain-containing protein [Blastocatellia bacterium]|nr:ATP-binding cassette domain-containing protein [Blastocatellia bacterium]